MASKGVNKVILIGNLGKDPEVRYLPNGGAVTNLTLATSESWKDKATGEQKEKTEWHRVSIFGKLAEIAGEYLRKGSKVYIEGKLQTRKWKDQSGNDRYTTEIVLDGFSSVMQMLDPPSSQGQQQGSQQRAPQQQQGVHQQQPAQQQPPRQQAPQQQGGFQQSPQQQAPQQHAPQQKPAQAPHLDDGWDDDIPFAPLCLQYPALMYTL